MPVCSPGATKFSIFVVATPPGAVASDAAPPPPFEVLNVVTSNVYAVGVSNVKKKKSEESGDDPLVLSLALPLKETKASGRSMLDVWETAGLPVPKLAVNNPVFVVDELPLAPADADRDAESSVIAAWAAGIATTCAAPKQIAIDKTDVFNWTPFQMTTQLILAGIDTSEGGFLYAILADKSRPHDCRALMSFSIMLSAS